MLAPAEKLLPIIDRLLKDEVPVIDGAKLHKLLTLCRARIEADNAWDAHSDELSRKAITAAHDTLHRAAVGLITLQAADVAVAAIIDTVSGLVPPETFTLLNDTLRSLRK